MGRPAPCGGAVAKAWQRSSGGLPAGTADQELQSEDYQDIQWPFASLLTLFSPYPSSPDKQRADSRIHLVYGRFEAPFLCDRQSNCECTSVSLYDSLSRAEGHCEWRHRGGHVARVTRGTGTAALDRARPVKVRYHGQEELECVGAPVSKVQAGIASGP